MLVRINKFLLKQVFDIGTGQSGVQLELGTCTLKWNSSIKVLNYFLKNIDICKAQGNSQYLSAGTEEELQNKIVNFPVLYVYLYSSVCASLHVYIYMHIYEKKKKKQ